MGLNLAEIQQKLDRLIQNMSEQNRRAYQIFYDPNPQDVTLPQLDENGNLVNVTIPNRAKIKAEVDGFIAGAETTIKGWWSQSFTVTTVQEFVDAISQIPTGGMGIITIPGGTELVLDRDIAITNNKTVLITGYSDSHAKIVFSPYQVDDTYYDYHRFSLSYGANLRFHYIDFELGTPPSDLQPKIKGLINALYSQNTSVVLGACSVALDGTQHFIESTAYGTVLAVGIYSSNITTNGSYVIHNTYRPCMLTKNAVTIDDDTKWVSDSNYLIS